MVRASPESPFFSRVLFCLLLFFWETGGLESSHFRKPTAYPSTSSHQDDMFKWQWDTDVISRQRSTPKSPTCKQQQNPLCEKTTFQDQMQESKAVSSSTPKLFPGHLRLWTWSQQRALGKVQSKDEPSCQRVSWSHYVVSCESFPLNVGGTCSFPLISEVMKTGQEQSHMSQLCHTQISLIDLGKQNIMLGTESGLQRAGQKKWGPWG